MPASRSTVESLTAEIAVRDGWRLRLARARAVGLRRWRQALPDLQRALELVPTDRPERADIALLLARCCLHARQPQCALELAGPLAGEGSPARGEAAWVCAQALRSSRPPELARALGYRIVAFEAAADSDAPWAHEARAVGLPPAVHRARSAHWQACARGAQEPMLLLEHFESALLHLPRDASLRAQLPSHLYNAGLRMEALAALEAIPRRGTSGVVIESLRALRRQIEEDIHRPWLPAPELAPATQKAESLYWSGDWYGAARVCLNAADSVTHDGGRAATVLQGANLLLGCGRPALARAALDDLEQPQAPQLRFAWLCSHARLAATEANLQEAEKALISAGELLDSLGPDAHLEYDVACADAYSRLNEWDYAWRHIECARKGVKALGVPAGSPAWQAVALLTATVAARIELDGTESLPHGILAAARLDCEFVLATWYLSSRGCGPGFAHALHARAMLQWACGRHARAVEDLTRARRVALRSGASLLARRCEVDLRTMRPSGMHLVEGYPVAYQWRMVYAHARQLADSGDLRGADEATSRCLELLERARAAPATYRGRRATADAAAGVYALAIQVAMRRHLLQPDAGFDWEALCYAERAKGRLLLDNLTDPQREASLRVSREQSLADLRTLAQNLGARNTAFVSLFLGTEFTARFALVDGELRASMTWVQDADRTDPCAMTSGEVAGACLTLAQELRDTVSPLPAAPGSDPSAPTAYELRYLDRPALSPEAERAADSLGALLAAPDGERPPRESFLLVSPHGPLNEVPPCVVRVVRRAPGTPEDREYLIQRVPVMQTPGALVTAATSRSRGAPPPCPGRHLLLCPDEAVGGRVWETFAPLGDAWIGADASWERLQEHACRYNSITFLTHGRPGHGPLQERLKLHGERYLSASDILALPLADYSLVLVPACHGDLSQVTDGGETLGVAWAFMLTGARAVVTFGSGPIYEPAAARLAAQILRNCAAGCCVPRAVADAQQLLLKSRRYGHPSFWAARVTADLSMLHE